MSYDRVIAAINQKKTDQIPSFEILENPLFIKKVSGIDPFVSPRQAYIKAYRQIGLDWSANILPAEAKKFGKNETVKDKKGDKYTEFGVSGSRWKIQNKKFTPEEVLSFKPLEEPTVQDEPVENMIKRYKEEQSSIIESTFLAGWNQWTLYEWCVETFDWEPFLLAAASEPDKFNRVLEDFSHLSLRNLKTWAESGAKVILTHDDLATTRGLVFSPDWYRKYIIPKYPKIWSPLKDKGIKVVFCSDGNINPLIDDIVQAGADGFLIEPHTNIEYIARRYPWMIIIGNIDTRVLISCDKEAIENEVKRCVIQAGHCPGYFFSVSNHIAQDVPVESIEYYFEMCRKYGRR